ncbi:glycosyltransferase [Enterococcus gilvus]|uniref:glycosyltransferase n=1 Tax=Enterococcus gilvus TaxID=160453 RepID=UPI0029126510|nr:glycosyltransferase [Enterococcus gilvus]MDU5509059.1 glycosyltransferase [Enterococcus gilvus]
MRILHYTLGFPPQRSGGLVGYAIDLMKEQESQGHDVIALYPGDLNFFKKKTYIKKNNNQIVDSYQIINSLPLAIFNGIGNPCDFMTPCSKRLFINFFKENKTEVVHVHTLMGIHKEFFHAANELRIPIIYSSHDYYGLAPDPNFFFKGNSYDDTNTVNDWIYASSHALNTNKLRLFQLKTYPLIRKILLILKKTKIEKNFNFSFLPSHQKKQIGTESYENLRNYYQDIFSSVNKFHFNSNLAKDVFINNLKKKPSYDVLTISNSKIINRTITKLKQKKTRVAYIGPDKDFKGYNDFVELSKRMKFNGKFEFHSYGHTPNSEISGIIQHGKYSKRQMDTVFQNIDILVVPSKWKETFGLVVLEAISFNTSVLVSSNVGAKDILSPKYTFKNIEELQELLEKKEFHNQKLYVKKMDTHCKEIICLYQSAVERGRD